MHIGPRGCIIISAVDPHADRARAIRGDARARFEPAEIPQRLRPYLTGELNLNRPGRDGY
jgi:hypothetical protein